MNAILGKKIGMTQVFTKDGQVVPVTIIEGGPCCIIQVKNKERDGYNAIQLGFGETKEKRVTKPLLAKFKKLKTTPRKFIKEIRVEDLKDYKPGQDIDVSIFTIGDYVDVVGTSLGKGFQGGMKRWGWSGGPKTHGSMSHRRPGSIGASAYPSRVFKGHHLPGHMGHQRVTLQGLEVVNIDKENNLLVVKGSVPGHDNGYLIVKKSTRKKAKVVKKEAQPADDKQKDTKKADKGKK